MKQNKQNICPHCNKPIDAVDVCLHCGHIINEENIKSMPSPATKNAKPNKFILFILSVFVIIIMGFCIGDSIVDISMHQSITQVVLSYIPALCIESILLTILVFLLGRYIYIKKNGEQYDGYVYGYTDDDYEGDNQTREQVCYIVYSKCGHQYTIQQSYNLGNRKIFDINDRPYAPGTKMKVFTHRYCYVCQLPIT